MKQIFENLANLVKVKTLVTLIVIIVFSILALRGTIDAENVTYIATSVIAFYFGTQHESNVVKQETNKDDKNFEETK